jgi:hypothetical protein
VITPPPLSDRRALFSRTVQWAGAQWLVGTGLDHRGVAIEIWIDAADEKVAVDPDVLGLVHECAISVSHLLRSGAVSAAAHADRLAATRPCLFAQALAVAAAVERDEGPEARRVHAWRVAAKRFDKGRQRITAAIERGAVPAETGERLLARWRQRQQQHAERAAGAVVAR